MHIQYYFFPGSIKFFPAESHDSPAFRTNLRGLGSFEMQECPQREAAEWGVRRGCQNGEAIGLFVG